MATQIAKKTIRTALLILLLVVIIIASGCKSLDAIGYEFGDVHRLYCGSTNEEFRAELEATFADDEVKFDINYCASFNLVDALVIKPIQNKKD